MSDKCNQEWLEADGLGGFASGTANGVRSRRYHALLLVATTPPTGRITLVNGFDAWVEIGGATYTISSQRYAPDVIGGDGARCIEAFGASPWPHWIYKLPDGTRIEQEIFVPKGRPMVCLSWKVLGPKRDVKLFVRPFLCGRDYHSLQKTNPGFNFDPEINPNKVSWQMYPGIPGVAALSNAEYTHQPLWYYNFAYSEERARGLDWEEDLAAPGILSWDLSQSTASLLLTTKLHAAAAVSAELFTKLRELESKRRPRFPSPLHAAAEAYLVERHRSVTPEPNDSQPESEPAGKTIIAGYPWFTDWGRDTFIALRGLCLSTGRLDVARSILLEWAGEVSQGMLPNRFPDHGEAREFNAVDASLWFIVAAYEYLGSSRINGLEKKKLIGAIDSILTGYTQGTRFNIRADEDGLLAAGKEGVQLTWMDAKVGDWVVTPRIGKPVEIQALWLNALWVGSNYSPRWQPLLDSGLAAFQNRFWNKERQCLYDVIDLDHQPGKTDASLRPNQLFAVGGLPLQLLKGEQAKLIVELCEDQLLTPMGLRSLGPREPGYSAHYTGGVWERDGAYHQGTVWPWLMGAFVEAWIRIRGSTDAAKIEARKKFVAPMMSMLAEAGQGHLPEIADGDAPHAPRGCPFQAWSLGELLRLECDVLRIDRQSPREALRSKSEVQRTGALAVGSRVRLAAVAEMKS